MSTYCRWALTLQPGKDLAHNRPKLRKACGTGVQHFEVVRVITAVRKHSRRKGSTSQPVPAGESSDTRPIISRMRIHSK